MNGASWGALPRLRKGAVIKGKWSARSWVVQSTLGVGANGAVYSVVDLRQKAPEALKVCENSGAAAFEWGILKRLQKVTNAFPQPRCIDDSAHSCALYFYVMEEVDGIPLNDVWHRLSNQQTVAVLLALGKGLEELHSAGYGFCDVKPQNILVNTNSKDCVRFVDVGGVTEFGRSVRQFTPSSDCAYWGFGNRRASQKYDMMAIALMIVCLENAPPVNMGEWPLAKRNEWMRRELRKTKRLGIHRTLEAVLRGDIGTAVDWNRALLRSHASFQSKVHSSSPGPFSRTQQVPVSSLRKTSSLSKRADWTERLMWATLCCAMVSTAGAWAIYLTGL